jgi:AraC-like DNA-binding protein
MKALPYKVPRTIDESFNVRIEDDLHFYGSLHTHSEIQITWINESKGTLVAGDYIGNFRPGQLFVIGSEQPHVFKNDPEYFNGEDGFRAYCISLFIHKEMFGPQFMQLPEVSSLNRFFEISDRGMCFGNHVNKSVYPLINSISEQKGLAKLICLLKILDLIISDKDYRLLASSATNKGINQTEGKRLNDVFQFLLNEFKRPVSLEEVSSVANLAPNSFCRYFKNHTGKSFSSFLSELRIGNASKLLQNKDLSISTVCFDSGFNNLSNFNRQFKALTGISPKEFRIKAIKAIK